MRIFNIIITTKKKQDDFIISCMQRLDRVDRMLVWAAINPVIYSLQELRNNTWDKDRVDGAIEWLTNNFKVEK